MEKMLSGRRALPIRSSYRVCVEAMGVLFLLAVGGTATAQEIAISGIVTAPNGKCWYESRGRRPGR